jgi:tetrahydromethanopterin S-methyltransferase subunit D
MEVQAMLRSIGSLLAGELTLVISSFAIEFVVDSILLRASPHSFANNQALAASNPVLAVTVGYTVLCSALAGVVTARIALRSKVKHAVALAVLQEALTVIAMLKHPELAPTWVWACNITLVPLAIVMGGKWGAAEVSRLEKLPKV